MESEGEMGEMAEMEGVLRGVLWERWGWGCAG